VARAGFLYVIQIPKLCILAVNHQIKILLFLSQACISKHSNVYSFTLLLPEGRPGEDWDSNKMLLFLNPLPPK
jgi:hypothetical protein